MQAQTPMRFFEARLDTAPLFADSVVNLTLLQHLMGTLTPDWDVTAAAADLTVPMLLALGRYDYTTPHVLWEPVVGLLPDVTARRFEESGHHPFFEEPDLFVDVVTEWMADDLQRDASVFAGTRSSRRLRREAQRVWRRDDPGRRSGERRRSRGGRSSGA